MSTRCTEIWVKGNELLTAVGSFSQPKTYWMISMLNGTVC